MIYSHMTMASHDALFDEPSFDAYDYILCSGTHHIDSFRALQNRRPSFGGKVLIPSGYPKLEYLMSQASTNASAKRISQKAAFVYAPTHVYKENERLASFGKYGEEIVDALIATGQHLIFRPHPTSLVDEDCGVVDRILRKYSDDRNFTFDNSIDYIASYSSADLMITDLSGTGFTFSFAFTRPTVFFAPFQDAEQGLSGIQFDGRHRIGALARSIEEMISEIARLQKTDLTQQIVDFRNETLFNVGHSHEYIADCVNDIVQGRSRSEWIQL
jgi:CDP-glycerol glycerophosphotransferase (TagB/SpsB family)